MVIATFPRPLPCCLSMLATHWESGPGDETLNGIAIIAYEIILYYTGPLVIDLLMCVILYGSVELGWWVVSYGICFFFVCFFVIPVAVETIGVASSAALIIGILVIIIVILCVIIIKGRKPQHGHQCTCQGTFSFWFNKWFQYVSLYYSNWQRYWNQTKWSLWTCVWTNK